MKSPTAVRKSKSADQELANLASLTQTLHSDALALAEQANDLGERSAHVQALVQALKSRLARGEEG